MMVFQRKQIVILALVLMVLVAGYLQYSYNHKSSDNTSVKSENTRLGEAVYVNNENIEVGQQKNKKDDSKSNKSEGTQTLKQAGDFFAQARLDKEVTRNKNTEALKAITNDANASKETKTKAYEQMMKIINNSEIEMKIETLLKEKGFSDALALFSEDGSIDIIVKAPNLTAAQTAQISDIVSRHAKVEMTKIHIRNIY